MVSISTWTLLAVLGAGGETVLMDFTASWCGPCRGMEPVIHRLQAEGYPVQQIDIDRNPQLAAQYKVTSVPCFVMVVGGREVDRVVGATSHERLARMFSAARFTGQAATDAEIRGQSPDRLPFGRLRQMVGGLRGQPDAPQQPSTIPPPAIESPSLPGEPASFDSGPEPPAALQNDLSRRTAPTNYDQPSADKEPGAIPAMAPNFGAVPGATLPSTVAPPSWPESPPAGAAATSVGSPEERAMAASVRLKVDDGQFFAYATGTIIAVQPNGEALILTCGHVFRDSQGRGAIAVEMFGPQRQGPMPGRLLHYDLSRDLGLVSVHPSGTVTPASFAGAETYFREGLRTFSIGCDRGAEPTVREGRITGVNRYLGAPNLEVSGRPVVGRSGGGLFDVQGSLLGVCRYADGELDEGVYVSLPAIRAQLEEWGQGEVFRAPPRTALAQEVPDGQKPQSAVTPAAASPVVYQDKPADFDYTQTPPGFARSAASPGPAANSASGEPLFIVRSHGQRGSEVMVLQQPSPAFLEQLSREQTVPLSNGEPIGRVVREAMDQVRLSQRNDEPIVRGQSPLQTH